MRNMGGESEAAWRGVLDDLVARGLRTPEFLIIDGAAGLEKALAALWPDVPIQRCTVHKHRNLLAHAPERAARGNLRRLHRHDLRRDARRRSRRGASAFIRKWRLKCRAVADSLEEAGERLFTFTRLPAEPMEVGANHERDRAAARRVQAPDQDADRAALRRNRGDAVLGAARLRADHHAQGRRMADPRREASRSIH